MAIIVTRAGKGSPLTHNEVDANFVNLNTDKVEKSGTDPVVINVNSASSALRITQTGTGHAFVVEDEANPDTSPFVIDSSGNVGVGTDAPTAKVEAYNNASGTTIRATGDGFAATLNARRYDNVAAGSTLALTKYRGSFATPAAVQTGDNAGVVTFQGFGGTNLRSLANIAGAVDAYVSDTDISTRLTFSVNPVGSITPVEQMRITSSGDLRFNSGYGSVATAYGCRSWVNFNGTGTVAILESGNVSSITDNGTGDYTVNFTTAMPDVNYCPVFGGQTNNGARGGIIVGENITNVLKTTTQLRILTVNLSSAGSDALPADATVVNVSIFR